MTARAVTIVDALKTVLLADATLAGWVGDRVHTFRDPILLEDTNPIYPYIILDVMDIRTSDAADIRMQDMARMTFPVIIYFACSALDEETVKRGTATVPGLYEIHDKIWTIIMSDKSLNDNVMHATELPAFSSMVGKSQSGENWIGRGLIIREVYQDIKQ